MAAVAILLNRRREAEEAAKAEQKECDEFGDAPEPSVYGIEKISEEEPVNTGDFEEEPLHYDDGVDEAGGKDDEEVLEKLIKKVEKAHEQKRNYISLCGFLSFLALYMAVLYLQQQSFQTYEIVNAHRQLLPSDTFAFESPADFYQWVNTSIIQNIYSDPACGDGVCSVPEEYPGFGRFGCRADCGVFKELTPVTIRFITSFITPDDQSGASWNLCLIYPAYFCWFETPKEFTGSLVDSIKEVLSIPDGNWQVVITAPNGGVTGQVEMNDDSAAANDSANRFSNVTKTLTSWGSCKPLKESRLETCRRTCSRYAVCAGIACGNLRLQDMANVAADCFAICDEDPQPIINAYHNATCYDVACDLNSTNSFMAVYKDFTSCTAEPDYDGRSPDLGLEGLSFSGTKVSGFNAVKKPVSSEHCTPAFKRKALEVQPQLPAATPTRTQRQLSSRSGALPSSSHMRWAETSKVSLGGSGRAVLAGAGLEANGSTWDSLGSSDHERLSTLEVAVARALYTWSKAPCTCPKSCFIDPHLNGAKFVAFFCTLLGGPTTLPSCNYTSPTTGRQLTTQAELAAAVKGAHKKLGLNFAQDQQDSFVSIFVNSLDSATKITPEMRFQLTNVIHELDSTLVDASLPPGCNSAYTNLNWQQGVEYNTTIVVGKTITWVWGDDDPHSIRELVSANGPRANFQGIGSGKYIVSRNTECSPENTGYLGINELPPRPCSVVDPESSSVQNSFSYSWRFDTPGVYSYEDGRFGSLMKGTITVLSDASTLKERTLAEEAECAPGCPLWQIRNGQCLEACNVDRCNFDGGDCSCADATTGSTTCTCYPGQTKGEDGACCEPQTVGVNLLFNFTLREFGSSSTQTDSVFLPNKGYVKGRTFALKNRLLVGMLIYQTRGSNMKCSSSRFSSLSPRCIDSHGSMEPYGVDPVFLATSILYNDNLSPSTYYPNNKTYNSLGIPTGFFGHSVPGFPDGFPVLFDVNLNNIQAEARLQYLVDGFYIDNATKNVHVQLITFNGDQQKFVNTEIECTFQEGGRIAIATRIDAISLDLYNSSSDYVRAVLECLVFLVVCYQVVGEGIELWRAWRKTNAIGAYFQSNWNYVDLASLCILFTCGILWISNYISQVSKFHIESRYDVYTNLAAYANFWGTPPGSAGLDTALSRFVALHKIMFFRSAYMAINGISLFLVMVRLLKFLDFQPRMGIITRSLALAGPELGNFFLLMATMFVIYSITAHLVFGRTLDEYRTVAAALATNFGIIIGDTSVESNLLLLQGWELAAGQIFYWTFVVLFTFVLMNFLIAIVVDAFVEAKGGPVVASGLPEEVFDILREEIEGIVRGRLSDKPLLRHLREWHPVNTQDKAKDVVPQSQLGFFSSLVDRVTNRDQCIRIPATDAVEGKGDEPVEMTELDYETLLNVLSRRFHKAPQAGSAKPVLPDKVCRSLFIRFGETPQNIAKVKTIQQQVKKKVGKDSHILLDILKRIEDKVAKLGEHLETAEHEQSTFASRLNAVEASTSALQQSISGQQEPSFLDRVEPSASISNEDSVRRRSQS